MAVQGRAGREAPTCGEVSLAGMTPEDSQRCVPGGPSSIFELIGRRSIEAFPHEDQAPREDLRLGSLDHRLGSLERPPRGREADRRIPADVDPVCATPGRSLGTPSGQAPVEPREVRRPRDLRLRRRSPTPTLGQPVAAPARLRLERAKLVRQVRAAENPTGARAVPSSSPAGSFFHALMGGDSAPRSHPTGPRQGCTQLPTPRAGCIHAAGPTRHDLSCRRCRVGARRR
jgi:hypothetical protein